MSKTIWIIGGVILVGAAVTAGLLFTMNRNPGDLAEGTAMPTATADVASIPASPEPTPMVVETVAATVSEPVAAVAEPIADDEAASGPVLVATLDQLIVQAAALERKEVIVQGAIVTQCIAGCQFSLEDGTGVVAVELVDDALDKVLDRGSVGRTVRVTGTLERSPRLVVVVEEPENWEYVD